MIIVMLVVVGAVSGLGGCAGTRARPDAQHLPDDFSLSVSVLPGDVRAAAWYIVEPDGTLRAALGAARENSARPGAVRVLTRAQVREVWELACAAGLAGEGTGKGKLVRGAPGMPGGAATVEVAAAGRRRTVIAPAASDAGGDRFAALEGRLRDLAWVEGTEPAVVLDPWSHSPW
jgi:hypothetical protein